MTTATPINESSETVALDDPRTLEQLQAAIASARKQGASAVKIWLNNSDDLSCAFEAGEPKSCSSAVRSSYTIEVVVGGRRGSASGNELGSLMEMMSRAVTLASSGGVAHFRDYPTPQPYQKVKSYSCGVERLSLMDLHDAAMAMSGRLKDYNSQLFVSARAHRNLYQGMLVTSSGQCYRRNTSQWNMGASVQRTEGTDMLFAGTGRSWKEINALYDTDYITGQIIQDLEYGQEIVPSPSGQVKVFIPAELVGSMLWPIFMGTDGCNVAKGGSPLRDKLGQQVFDPGLTIIDDPHLDYCHSCGEVDGDGVPAKETTIFERGTLKTFLYDWDTAHLAGTSPTGHNGCWPWSTYIAPGALSEQELLAGMDDGLIIKSLIGFGQGNIINGDFSCNVALGYRVKNGHIVGRVKNTMVAGNLYELLSRNVLVGRDSDPMHRHPVIVLDGVNVTSRR